MRIDEPDGDKVEAFAINVPDAVGFLLLKTAVGDFREQPTLAGRCRSLARKLGGRPADRSRDPRGHHPEAPMVAAA
jgi:hypothetical protein